MIRNESIICFAHDWNGTSSFRSLARFLRYPVGGFQMPERSGLPSARRGAGADRSGRPSGVRGIAFGGTFAHWADTGAPITIMRASIRSVLISGLLDIRGGVLA